MSGNDIADILGERFGVVARHGALALEKLDLAADAAVLDVGTGAGNFAIYLAAEGFQVLTGEPSTDETHYAGQDWANNAEKAGVRDKIRFEAFDASDMPFPPEMFDGVFFFGVLHHVEEKLRGDVFREALRVVKDEGAVVFFEPRDDMIEVIRTEDPEHPEAANPAEYLGEAEVREEKLTGDFMDIYIYRKTGA